MDNSTRYRPKWTNGWQGYPRLFSDVPPLCSNKSSPPVPRTRHVKPAQKSHFRYPDKFDSLMRWWKDSLNRNRWRNIYTLYLSMQNRYSKPPSI